MKTNDLMQRNEMFLLWLGLLIAGWATGNQDMLNWAWVPWAGWTFFAWRTR